MTYTNHGRFKPDDPIFREGLKVSTPVVVRVPLAKVKPPPPKDED